MTRQRLYREDGGQPRPPGRRANRSRLRLRPRLPRRPRRRRPLRYRCRPDVSGGMGDRIGVPGGVKGFVFSAHAIFPNIFILDGIWPSGDFQVRRVFRGTSQGTIRRAKAERHRANGGIGRGITLVAAYWTSARVFPRSKANSRALGFSRPRILSRMIWAARRLSVMPLPP